MAKKKGVRTKFLLARIREYEASVAKDYATANGLGDMSFSALVTTLMCKGMGAPYLAGKAPPMARMAHEAPTTHHLFLNNERYELLQEMATALGGKSIQFTLEKIVTDAYYGASTPKSAPRSVPKAITKVEEDGKKPIDYANFDVDDVYDCHDISRMLEVDRSRISAADLSKWRSKMKHHIDGHDLPTKFIYPLICEIGDKVKDKWRTLKAKHPLAASLLLRYSLREDPLKMDLTNFENIVPCYLKLFHLEHNYKAWEQFDLDVKAYDAIIDPMTVAEMIEYTKTNFSPPKPIPDDWVMDHANMFGLVREGGNLKETLKPQCLEFFCRQLGLGDYPEMLRAKREEFLAMYGL